MQNNLYNLLFFPELILLTGSLCILLLGLFIKKNNFSIISNLSTILLVLTGIVTYIDRNTSFLNFNNFFIESNFIKFFQLLVIFGSISVILISKNYYKSTSNVLQLSSNILQLSLMILNFLKKYSNLRNIIEKSIYNYTRDVKSKKFPFLKNIYKWGKKLNGQ